MWQTVTALKPILFVSVCILITHFFLSSSLHSLLWKFLLAHPWICLAALTLLPCHNPSLGAAISRYVSGEPTSERGRGQAYRLHANRSGGFSFSHGQTGLAQRQRQSLLLKAGIPSETWCDERSTTLVRMDPSDVDDSFNFHLMSLSWMSIPQWIFF